MAATAEEGDRGAAAVNLRPGCRQQRSFSSSADGTASLLRRGYRAHLQTRGEGTRSTLQGSDGDDRGRLLGSPNGKPIVTRSESAAITELADQYLKPVPLVGDGQDDIEDVTFSPDGKLFGTLGSRAAGRIWSESGGLGRSATSGAGRGKCLRRPAFSPTVGDSRRLSRGAVARLSVEWIPAKRLGVRASRVKKVLRLVFSPDGTTRSSPRAPMVPRASADEPRPSRPCSKWARSVRDAMGFEPGRGACW